MFSPFFDSDIDPVIVQVIHPMSGISTIFRKGGEATVQYTMVRWSKKQKE
jgi:hypothetical protein